MSNTDTNTVIPEFTRQYWKAMKIDNELRDQDGNIIKPWSRRRRYYNDLAMYKDIMLYFTSNAETQHIQVDKKGLEVMTKEPLQWLDLIHALGMQKSTLLPYKAGDYDDEDNNFSGLLGWAREVVQADQQKGATMGVYSDRMVIQNLSANYGWNVDQKISIESTTYLTTDEATKMLVTQMGQLSQLLGIGGKAAQGAASEDNEE